MSAKNNTAQRGKLAMLVKLNYSVSRIAKELGMPKSTAQDWRAACLEDEQRFLSGPQYSKLGNPKFSEREAKRFMTDFRQLQPCGSDNAAEEISAKPGSVDVSGRTLRRRARKLRWHPYLRPPKPQLNACHKTLRFQFSKGHDDENWDSWAFNDQFRIPFPLRAGRTPFWSDSHAKVPSQPTQKFPPMLNVHAAITRLGPVPLVQFEPPLNSDKFVQVNESNVIPALIAKFEGAQFRYAHDHASWFRSAKSQTYFGQETPECVEVVTPAEFPPLSPDFNLSENAMAIALKRLAARRPKPRSLEETFQTLQEEWMSLDEVDCAALWSSMPERLRECRAKKGGNTSY
jgi:hypothetical protein